MTVNCFLYQRALTNTKKWRGEGATFQHPYETQVRNVESDRRMGGRCVIFFPPFSKEHFTHDAVESA